MKKKCLSLMLITLMSLFLFACGKEVGEVQFEKEINQYCDKFYDIDQTINQIDPADEKAVSKLLDQFEELRIVANSFSQSDFPEQYDYLEPVAKEVGTFMEQAVSSYKAALNRPESDDYEKTIKDAMDNYEKACRRIKIIVSFLNGETPDNVTIHTN